MLPPGRRTPKARARNPGQRRQGGPPKQTGGCEGAPEGWCRVAFLLGDSSKLRSRMRGDQKGCVPAVARTKRSITSSAMRNAENARSPAGTSSDSGRAAPCRRHRRARHHDRRQPPRHAAHQQPWRRGHLTPGWRSRAARPGEEPMPRRPPLTELPSYRVRCSRRCDPRCPGDCGRRRPRRFRRNAVCDRTGPAVEPTPPVELASAVEPTPARSRHRPSTNSGRGTRAGRGAGSGCGTRAGRRAGHGRGQRGRLRGVSQCPRELARVVDDVIDRKVVGCGTASRWVGSVMRVPWLPPAQILAFPPAAG